MALIAVNQADNIFNDTHVDFAAIWEHYLASRFLYPAKLERLAPVLDLIHAGWPLLLAAAPEIFQCHVVPQDSTIISSLCAFRDTDQTFVIQHAASSRQPWSLLECIHSAHAAIRADPTTQFLGWYFRPENRWPSRLVHSINDVFPPHLMTFTTREYLICCPQEVDACLPMPTQVQDGAEVPDHEVAALAAAAMGPLHAAALGIGQHPLSLPALNARYAHAGLRRSRRVLAGKRDGALAGIALCHISSVPMNFSFLCNRVEILVHPDAPDRANVVRDLAYAAIRESARRGDPVVALLIDADNVAAAAAGGFETTGKRYASVLWAREGAEGWPSVVHGIDHLYATVRCCTSGTRLRNTSSNTLSDGRQLSCSHAGRQRMYKDSSGGV